MGLKTNPLEISHSAYCSPWKSREYPGNSLDKTERNHIKIRKDKMSSESIQIENNDRSRANMSAADEYQYLSMVEQSERFERGYRERDNTRVKLRY